MTLEQLQEQKNKLAKTIEEYADRYNESGQWRDAEEEAAWARVNEDYDRTAAEIEELQKREMSTAVSDRLAAIREEQTASRSSMAAEVRGESRSGYAVTEATRQLALQGWMRKANHLPLKPAHRRACERVGTDFTQPYIEYQLPTMTQIRGYGGHLSGGKPYLGDFESRALDTSTANAGGETIPEGFVNELERSMLAFNGVRQVARIMRTASGNDMPWPTVDDTSNTGALLAENTTIGASTDPTFDAVLFKAYKYSSKLILVSQELLEDSAFNLSMVIASLLGERIGRITETHFTTGDNSSKPQGVVTAATGSLTTAGATAITTDEILDLQHDLDPSYRALPSVRYMMHDGIMLAVRKLKDSQNQYLWQPNNQMGAPDTLAGFPVVINQNMQSTLATATVTVLFGAFEKYVIREAASLRFYRLEERYRDLDQTGFVAFMRMDGRTIQANAIRKLTQA